jgi:hypothetical protein
MEIDLTEDVPEYRGFPILGTKAIVNKTGDGLSAAIGVEHLDVPEGGTGFLVVKIHNTKDRHDWKFDDDMEIVGCIEVRIFDAVGVIQVDEELVGEAYARMMDRIRKAEELKKKGQQSFPEATGDIEIRFPDDEPAMSAPAPAKPKRGRPKKEVVDAPVVHEPVAQEHRDPAQDGAWRDLLDAPDPSVGVFQPPVLPDDNPLADVVVGDPFGDEEPF